MATSDQDVQRANHLAVEQDGPSLVSGIELWPWARSCAAFAAGDLV
jgi:hypothetical protein